ncbi:MAG: hypothetical protein ACFCVE_10455 [Phycisphaerae bacterium]
MPPAPSTAPDPSPPSPTLLMDADCPPALLPGLARLLAHDGRLAVVRVAPGWHYAQWRHVRRLRAGGGRVFVAGAHAQRLAGTAGTPATAFDGFADVALHAASLAPTAAAVRWPLGVHHDDPPPDRRALGLDAGHFVVHLPLGGSDGWRRRVTWGVALLRAAEADVRLLLTGPRPRVARLHRFTERLAEPGMVFHAEDESAGAAADLTVVPPGPWRRERLVAAAGLGAAVVLGSPNATHENGLSIETWLNLPPVRIGTRLGYLRNERPGLQAAGQAARAHARRLVAQDDTPERLLPDPPRRVGAA